MKKKRRINRIISMIVLFTMCFTSLGLENFAVEAATTYTTLYLVDDTDEQWVGNDNAVIELVDNTYGHDHYIMTKINSNTWSAKVPSSTYNVTFNRLSPDQSTQWNSWSAGGRDSHNAYHVLGFEYGYWDGTAELEEGFHAGDVVYLDFYEFSDWGNTDAFFYVNFTDASKEDNGGSDITIKDADSSRYAPILLSDEIEDDVFTYTVTEEEEGATELRFWRGNADTLWNCSVTLSYKDYKAGNNCAKIQGWNDEGYVCPYVPRRHVPVIDTMELKVSGNQKVNRKITVDLVLEGETDLLTLEDTVITIEKEGEGDSGDESSLEGTVDTGFLLYDDSKTAWNHRELLFTEAGTYHITAVATDGTDEFTTETYITIVKDEAPVADFDFDCEEGNIYLRDETGTARVTVKDVSVSELGDTINSRIYSLYYDANADGVFSEEERIDTRDGNDLSVSYDLTLVGNYMVTLLVQETFEDTIPELLDESAYLGDDTTDKEENRVMFEITNQAPVSSVHMEKSKTADIVFTVGNAEEETLKQYTAVTQKVEEQLKELGIDAKVSTVSTSALTAQDTFAWTEYDHYNYQDWHLPTMEKHILYEGNDITMMGYSVCAIKDFLFVEDTNSSKKVFEFDLQRDYNNWHSMEGGGFLFDTVVSESENYIQGYAVLVTESGLKLVQINRVSLSNFRDGTYYYVQNAGKLLQTFPMQNLYAEHHLKIIVEKNTVTVYDGDTLLIDEYVLPDDGVEAYGYGPIISHVSHSCSQQSYFTFKNISMQTFTGESLSDVVNSHEWTPGTNHYVINLSETTVPELSDNDRTADVAASLIANDAMFFGIGNETTINQYNGLLNSMEGMGENIRLSYALDEETGDSSYQGNVEEAVDQIVARIVADVRSKDYSIGYTIATDEEVVYTGTYSDPENDPVGSEEWTYVYDASVFGEIQAEIKTMVQETPITMFTESGAYEISHRVSDDPAGDNEAMDSYIQWSDTDEYKKLILSQHRPTATITVDTMQSETDSTRCLVNVVYAGEDPDHPTDSKKGIREEKFYYKELGDTQWTEGRFPTQVEMGSTYLIKYIVTDIEGTVSRPAVAAVKTTEAKTYVKPSDTNQPEVNLTVSSTLVEVGESFYVEASAMDDYGVDSFVVQVNGEEFRTTYGRYEYLPEQAGEYTITARATDIGGNETTETVTVTVIDNSDVIPPEITLDSQTSGAISGNIVLTGSITDNKELKSYTVTRTKVDTGTGESSDTGENGETTEESVVIASGTKEIRNGTIAEIETAELENGVYRVEILAEDTAGLASIVSLVYTVNRKTIDRTPPQAVIDDVILDEETDTISVIGSVTDETALGMYQLIIFPTSRPDDTTILSMGLTEVEGETIGTIPANKLGSYPYTLQLLAWDRQGNSSGMEVEFEYEKTINTQTGTVEKVEIKREEDTTVPVIAGELKAAITEEGLALTLTGTIADENLKEYTVVTGKADSENNPVSPVTLKTGSETVENAIITQYTYDKFEAGTYMIRVTAVDEAGNKRVMDFFTDVTVQGNIDDGYTGESGESGESNSNSLNLVLSGTVADTGDTLKVYLTYPEEATDIRLTADGAKVELYGRTADITADTPGEVEVTLTATLDGEEKSVTRTVRFFDPEDTTHPKASFLTPEADSELKTKTEITGTVWDETSLAYYTLEYRMEGTDTFREIARGEEMIENGVLGELDTSLLENGRYLLRLTVVDNGGNRIRVERAINVTGNLKVGNFFLSFTDISANVSGVPLTVIRSYDSRNKNSGDFGTGWRLGLQSVRLTEANDLTTGYEMIQQGEKFSTGYYIVQPYCHDITVTYGDGTSDRFALKVSPERQAILPIYEVKVNFVCLTDPKVKLELNGDNRALLSGEELIFEDESMMDSRSYILTKADGTKWYLSAEHGLLKMEDTNGNTVTLNKNGFTHSNGSGITFTRDEKGRIIKAEETNSEGTLISSLTYAYDDNDNLIAVTDKAGRTVTFTYDEDHNLIDIIDPSGMAVARNEYDEDGRLVATIDSDGNRVEYEHDIEGRTETVRDKMGNVTVYTYDDNGNILKTVDALGNVTTSTYDENNNLVSSTDALGNVTTYGYDENRGLTSLTMADGVTETLEYNTLNMVSSISLGDTLLMTMDYDDSGNLTSMTDSLGNETELSYASDGNLTGITDSIGVVQTLTYDDSGNLTAMTDGNGNSSTFTYDEKGTCTGVTVKRTEADGTVKEYTSTYQYDSAGNVVAAISTTGAVTAYEYDFRNNCTAVVSPSGKRTEYTYDDNANLVGISYHDGTTESFTYDENGNLLSATGRLGTTVTMTYDKLNRLTAKTYPEGTRETYTYDANGNVLTYTSVSGGVTTYTYDCRNRNTSITDAYGNVTTFEYSERSLLTKTTDAMGNEFRYTYDLNGKQTAVIYPDGSQESVEYDARGRVTGRTDRNGNKTTYGYDNADNLILVTDANGGTYHYTYNETYGLTAVTDANGNTTRYEYDGEGRLIKTTNALGNSTGFSYDKEGNLTGYTDYAGNRKEYLYDEAGRLVKTTDAEGETTYSYDTLGRLIKVTDDMGSIHYTYDEYSRISEKETYDLGTIVYGYDTYGRIGSITTKVNGVETGTTSYEYDLLDRVVRVIAHDGTATLYEYDAIGNRTAVRHEGGLSVTYEYDVCSRLVNEIVTEKDSNVLMCYHYTYGAAGEKTQAVEVVRESAKDTTVTVICNDYTYDNLLRLTGETIQVAENVPFDTVVKETEETNTIDITGITWDGSITNQYIYDAVSNRTGKTTTVSGTVYEMADSIETGSTTYTYNALNQLVSAANGDTKITYTYDINGNLVSEHGGSEDKTYTYDADNRLMIVTLSSGNNVTIESYTYDYEGNRISKQLNEDGKIYYLNDTFQHLTQVALELKKQEDGTYGVEKYYTRGTELIKADIYGDSEGISETYTTKQYIMDGHGSVTALAETDETGTLVTDTYTYDAYGTLLKKTGTTDNDYLYTGEQYNEATGLYYLRARYMNPETGTFISMDSYAGSLDNPVSLHKYLYANANPVMYTDPTGYFSLAESSVVQGMKSVLNTGMQSLGNLRKVMSWANMAVTLYDIHEQIQLLQSGEGSILGLVLAIAGGIVTQAFLNCTLTKLLGNAANTVLKVIGVAQDAGSFLKAVKSGDPEKIVVETVRLIVSIFTLKCQCFTGETLVSTTEGDKQIDEIEVGDYVYAYDTETGENIAAKVTYVSITETDILVHVYTLEGEEIKTTMLHPFYVKNAKSGDEEHGVWKAASNLVKGDELLTEDGRIVYVEEIRIERLTESIQVYNLEVEGLHTYYVGSGVLVHNEYGVPKNKSTLWGKEKNVTENGLNLIKEHLSGELSDEFNIAMIERIENAFKNGNKITGADLDFYAHEIYEAMMMSKGMTYENAHDAAKAFYNAIEYNFYHPDVIKKLKRLFGSSWFEFWDIERD